MPKPERFTPIENPAIQAVFDHFPDDVRPRLLALRQLIFSTASTLKNCGGVTETLKWHQPSYQRVEPRSGTPIRLGMPKRLRGHYALYVHCQTSVMETVQQIYGDQFSFEGTRGVLMRAEQTYPTDALAHIISIALTYHRP